MNEQKSATEIPSRLHVALTWGALVVFALLLTAGLDRREFWTDENITAGHLASLRDTADAFHPRGYYLMLYAWKRLAGDTDLSLRVFSVPWALLALVGLLLLGRQVASAGQTLLAAWMFVLSPFVLLYFRMARFYSLVAALSMAVAWLATLVLRSGGWLPWIGLGLASAALMGVNYVAGALLFPLLLWLLVVAVRRRQVLRWLVAAAPPAIAVALSARGVLAQAIRIGGIEAASDPSPLHFALRMGLPVWSLAVGETSDPWRVYITIPALLAMLAALVMGWQSFGRSRPAEATEANSAAAGLVRCAWPLSIVVVGIVLGTIARGEPLASAARSSLFAAPAAFILAAVGLTRIRRPWVRAAALAAILVADLYGLRNYFAGEQFMNPAYVIPWREIARTIETREQPADMVLCYYDDTILRYGSFRKFILGRPDYFPDQLVPVEQWPRDKRRLWLIARDRGSAEARRLQTETLAQLIPRARRIEIDEFMRYSDLDRKFRETFLKRKVEPAYIRIYLLSP